jgi:hypothetical protein
MERERILGDGERSLPLTTEIHPGAALVKYLFFSDSFQTA